MVAVRNLEAADSRAYRLLNFAARTSTGRCPAAWWGSVAILFDFYGQIQCIMCKESDGESGTPFRVIQYWHVIGYMII